MGEEKKVSLQSFLADHKITSMWKKFVLALYSTNNKFLLVARHNLAIGLQNALNVGPANFTHSLSPSSIVKKVGTGSRNSHGT